MAKSELETIVADLCRKFPKAQKKTLARKLHADYPALFPTIERARDSVRYYCGARGAKHRKSVAGRSTVRPLGKAGELPPLPDATEDDWQPFVLDSPRTLLLSDIHLPHHSAVAINAALKYGDSFNPTAVLINGDLFDFYQLSRFDRNPTLPKVSAELHAGGQFFDHLRARYPKAEIVFKKGNHDERWDKYLFIAAPLLADIPEIANGWQGPAGIVRNSVAVVGDQRPVMLGKLPVFHGHELGKGLSAPVNPARGAFLRAHHTILVGHSHQTSGHADTNVWHDETFCWSTGCLCRLTPEYARVNRWNYGFAAVVVSKDGTFEVQNKRISKDGSVRAS